MKNLRLGAFTHDVELPLKTVFIESIRTADEDLLDIRLGNAGDATNGVSFYWCVAPPQDRQTFLLNDAFENSLALQSRMFLDRQEHHPRRISASGRKRKSELLALSRKELMRDLDEYSGTIPGLGIATTGSAMGQVDEDFKTLLDYRMTLLAANTGNEPHTASVVFVSGIVETLSLREPCHARVDRRADVLRVICLE